MPLSSFTPKSVRVLRDRKAEFPEAANGRVKALRQVFGWAVHVTVELATANPARDVAYFPSKGEDFILGPLTKLENMRPGIRSAQKPVLLSGCCFTLRSAGVT
jgi:hypothetical protein